MDGRRSGDARVMPDNLCGLGSRAGFEEGKHEGTVRTPDSKNTKPLPFRYQFAAGAVAGISEILVM
jgi:hypothetical protein